MEIPVSPHRMHKKLPECPLVLFAPLQAEMTVPLLPGAGLIQAYSEIRARLGTELKKTLKSCGITGLLA